MNPHSIGDFVQFFGAGFFGAVIGWIAAEILNRSKVIGVIQLGGIVGVIAGAAVTGLFQNNGLFVLRGLFGCYCIGLGVTFFASVILKDPDIGRVVNEETRRRQKNKGDSLAPSTRIEN